MNVVVQTYLYKIHPLHQGLDLLDQLDLGVRRILDQAHSERGLLLFLLLLALCRWRP